MRDRPRLFNVLLTEREIQILFSALDEAMIAAKKEPLEVFGADPADEHPHAELPEIRALHNRLQLKMDQCAETVRRGLKVPR